MARNPDPQFTTQGAYRQLDETVAALGPMAGPGDENIFQGRFRESDRVDFTRKRFHQTRDEGVSIWLFETDLIVQYRHFHA